MSYLRHQHLRKDPFDREQQKTMEDRAEDITYTLNHFIMCSATDIFDAYGGRASQNWIQKNLAPHAKRWFGPGAARMLSKFHIGCGHNHGEATNLQLIAGEAAGDVAAVPITIAMQRIAPDFMHGIELGLEPVFGPIFHKSAEMSTERWAKRKGIPNNSEEYKQHIEEIYEHEISHLPQAAVWTVASIAVNAATQRGLGNNHSLTVILLGKLGGTLLSTGLVVGARAASPLTMRKLDKWTTKNIVAPASKRAGKLLGINEEAIEHVLEEQEEKKEINWEEYLTTKRKPGLYDFYSALGHSH